MACQTCQQAAYARWERLIDVGYVNWPGPFYGLLRLRRRIVRR